MSDRLENTLKSKKKTLEYIYCINDIKSTCRKLDSLGAPIDILQYISELTNELQNYIIKFSQENIKNKQIEKDAEIEVRKLKKSFNIKIRAKDKGNT